MRYGITTDYDESTERTQAISVWSGPFCDTYAAGGRIRKGARAATLTTYNGDKVRVIFPDGISGFRDTDTYQAIDDAISEALNAHHETLRRS